MALRDNLRNYFADDLEGLEPDVQEAMLDDMSSSRNALEEYMQNDPLFSQMTPEEQFTVLTDMAPEYYDNPTLEQAEPVVAQEEMTMEQLGLSALRGMSIDPEAQPKGPVERAVSTGVNEVITRTMEGIAGLSSLGEEVMTNPIMRPLFPQDPQVISENIGKGVAALRNEVDKNRAELAQFKQTLTPNQNLAFDAAVEIADGVPAMLMGIAAGPVLPAVVYGARGAGQSVERTTEAGYGKGVAALRGGVSGAIAGLTTGLSIKAATAMHKPVMRRMLGAALVDTVGGVGAGTAELTADWVIDKVFKDKQQGLIPPDMDFWAAAKQIAYLTLLNVVSGQVNTGVGEIWNRAKLHADGLKPILTPDGNAEVIVPRSIADSVESIMGKQPDLIDPANPQATADSVVRSIAEADMNLRALKDIEADQAATPLQDLIDPDAEFQAGPMRQPGRLKTDQRVSVSPKFFEGKTSQPLTEGLPGKIVSVKRTPGKTAGGKDKVDRAYTIQLDDGTIIPDVPRRLVVMNDDPEFIRGREGVEAPDLVRMMQMVFRPRGDVSTWTPEQAVAAMNALVTPADRLGRGALGRYGRAAEAQPARRTAEGKFVRGRRERGPSIAIVKDLVINHPDKLPRALAHEFGHHLYDPGQISEKLGLPKIKGFKEMIGEMTDFANGELTPQQKSEYQQYLQSTPADERISLPEWYLNRYYGSELRQFWDNWALYPRKQGRLNKDTGLWEGGNIEELTTNALSMFVNGAMGAKRTGQFDPSTTQFAQLFNRFMEANPLLHNSLQLMRARARGGKLNSIYEMLDRSGEAMRIGQERARGDKGESWDETLMGRAVDAFYPIRKKLDNPQVGDRLDAYHLGPTNEARFVEEALGPIHRTIRDTGITYEDISAAVFARRVINDRRRTIDILKPGSDFESIDAFKEQIGILQDVSREKHREANPTMSDMEIQKLVDADIAALKADQAFQREMPLLNPLGFQEADALETLAEINRKYQLPDGVQAVDVIDNLWDNVHAKINEWLLPTLIESGQYTPARLNRIKENKDYATFAIAHHYLHHRPGINKPRGSVGQFFMQEGSVSDVADPVSTTVDRLSRMAQAARKASLLRDLVSEIATKDFGQDNPGAYELQPGQRITDDSYERISTRKWDGDRMVSKDYAVLKKYLSGFETGVQFFDSAGVFGRMNAYMKGWLTAYNPRFWITNFFFDTTRSALNLPGLTALIYQPTRAVYAALDDLVRQGFGADNPIRDELIKRNLLLGGLDYYVNDPSATLAQRQASALNANPEALGKKWKDVQGMWNAAMFLKNKTLSGLKRFAKAVGRSTEMANKIAATRYLDRFYPNMPQETKNWYIRNAVGTPILTKKGSWNNVLDAMFTFYNPNVQGLVSDFQVIRKQGIGGALNGSLAKRIGILAALNYEIISALSGEKGEEVQDLVQRMPVMAWMTGLNFPMGKTLTGDTAYINLPFDPFTQYVQTLMFSTALMQADKLNVRPFDAARQAFTQLGRGGLNINPLAQLGLDTGEMLLEGNITTFTGDQLLSKEVQENPFTKEWFWELGKHVLRSPVGGPVNIVYRFPYGTNSDKPMGEREQADAGTKVLSDLQAATGLPVVPMFTGLVRFSQRGIKEWADYQNAAQEARNMADRSTARQAVRQVPGAAEKLQEIVASGNLTPERLKMIESAASNELERRQMREAFAKVDPSLVAYLNNYLNARETWQKDAALIKLGRAIKMFSRSGK